MEIFWRFDDFKLPLQQKLLSIIKKKTMKKMFLVGLMLTTMLAAQAQLKVAPKMQKGDQKSYVTTTAIDIPGQGAVNINTESTLNVAEAKADGFVLKLENTKVTSDAQDNNIAGKILAAAQEMQTGIAILLATDKDGKPLSITNYADVKKQIEVNSGQLIDKMLTAAPQLEQMMPKDALKQQLMASVTEEKLLNSLLWSVNPLALNGKTIMTGAQEEYVNDQGIKMKRLYVVNGQSITATSSANLTKEETKKLIIEQVEKAAPAQAEMIKQNIDQVLDSGMVKIDMKETATYDLQADGWIKSIKAENTNETMGQKMTVSTTVTLQ